MFDVLGFVQSYFRESALPSALSRSPWTPHRPTSHKSRCSDCSCVTNSQHSPLMHLPPELILYIALFVPKRYEPRRDLADHTATLAKSDLTALATVSKSLRQVLLPILFADVNVHSSSRLTALSRAPDHILGLVRTFTVQLDLDFYETWIWSLDHKSGRSSTSAAAAKSSNPSAQAFNSPVSSSSPKRSQSTASGPLATTNHQHARSRSTSDPVYALASILVRTAPTLRTFRFVMHSRPTSSGSAWSQFPRPGMAGIPFAGDVVAAMESYYLSNFANSPAGSDSSAPTANGLCFPELRNLNLDGTADIQPFLALTPNLTSLRLRIPEGFNAVDCGRIIHSLPLVPNLRQLEMWVWELAAAPAGAKPSASANDNNTTTAPQPAPNQTEVDTTQLIQRERVRLLGLIGQACPNLEWLGFQTRSFDYADGGMGLRVVGEKGFDWKDLVPALAQFPALRQLHLPGTLHSKDERYALALNMKSAAEGVNAIPSNSSIVQPTASSSQPSASTSVLTSLEKIETRERETSALLFHSSCGQLDRISWVRAEGLVGVEYVLPDDASEVQKSPVASTLAYATREYKSRLFDPEWWDEETQLLWDDDDDGDHYYTYDTEEMGLTARRQRESQATYSASLTSQLRDLGAGAAMVYRAIFPRSNRPGQFRAVSKNNQRRRRTSPTSPSRRAALPRTSAAANFRSPVFDPHFHDRLAAAGGSGSSSFLNGWLIYGIDAETITLLGIETVVYMVFFSTLAVASWRTSMAVIAYSTAQIQA